MANQTYTVVKGDTLWDLAKKYGTTVAGLLKLNPDITNPDYIVVGQKIVVSGEAAKTTKNLSARPVINVFGLQSNTDRSVFATWKWDKNNTDHYEVKWLYYTGDGVGFIGNESDATSKQSIYSAPENATCVSFKVKPVSKTYKANNKEVHYWTAGWSTVKKYYFKNNPPSKPSAPSVTIEDFKLTATLENLDLNAKTVFFQVVKNDSSVFNSGTAKIKTNSASYSCPVAPGNKYKVRCRAERGDLKSDWSDYSGNTDTGPTAPKKFLTLKALSETSVYLDWTGVSNATNYEVEYTTDKKLFDSSTDVQKMSIESVVSHAEITGLDSGEEWFFRVRATNSVGNSAWTEIKSIKIGTAPAAPTTWSSSTTVLTGEPLTLYWNHNSEDGSSQTYAELEVITNGSKKSYPIKNTEDEDLKDKTSSYSVDTSGYSEGTKIQWRVRTRGILETFGEWSIQRTVDVYAPPTLELSVTDSTSRDITTLTSFPFYISGVPGPDTQNPIGYHVSITSNEVYETVDNIGNPKTVNSGEEVYSKYFDVSDNLLLKLSAGDLSLENNVTYTITCTVSMNSGLTGEASSELTVSWGEDSYWPDAEIAYDSATYSASVGPYCTDDNGTLISGVTLSIYRREFDGSFTELATGLNNTGRTFVTDPHPSLDFARYRIVATDDATGQVTYYDSPGYPIGEKAVIIQWAEEWTNFEADGVDALEQPEWSGSLLRLPYNIDVSDSNSIDVELVEYIGRQHPVSYYGTQLGQTASWNVDIVKSDKETLYALRRLAVWMGDVYVREPSGSGYWANISVSFSQKHAELTIPVTLEISRVEGGA